MKNFLILCLVIAGLVGLAPAKASAAIPSVVHINETVLVERGGPYYHHYYHHRYHHRRYYWRHHRRYYY